MAMLNPATFHKSLHLDEDQLEQPIVLCPLCLSAERYSIGVLQESPEVLLMKCTTCDAASASRIPTQEAMNDYYNKSYEPIESDRITFNDISRLGKHLSLVFSQHNKNKIISILDFGGGDGSIAFSLAKELVKAGVDSVDITVVDYGASLVSIVDDKITINKNLDLEEIDGYFDFVIASAVLEHLPAPKKSLEYLLSRLKANGIFYARTPYIGPLLRTCSSIGIGVDFTYPAHLHDLGQGFWENYFIKRNINMYEVLKSKPSIVQTTFKDNFFKTLAAYTIKFPWYVLGKHYKYVGGWEIFVQKNAGSDQ